MYFESKLADVKIGIFPIALSFDYPFHPCRVKQRKDREAVLNGAQPQKRMDGEKKKVQKKTNMSFPYLFSSLVSHQEELRSEAIMCSPARMHFWQAKHMKQTSRKCTEGSRWHGEERRVSLKHSVFQFSSPVLITVSLLVVPLV